MTESNGIPEIGIVKTVNDCRFHANLAIYYSTKPLYMDSPTQNKPNTRKLVQLAWQQNKGEMWDE